MFPRNVSFMAALDLVLVFFGFLHLRSCMMESRICKLRNKVMSSKNMDIRSAKDSHSGLWKRKFDEIWKDWPQDVWSYELEENPGVDFLSSQHPYTLGKPQAQLATSHNSRGVCRQSKKKWLSVGTSHPLGSKIWLFQVHLQELIDWIVDSRCFEHLRISCWIRCWKQPLATRDVDVSDVI